MKFYQISMEVDNKMSILMGNLIECLTTILDTKGF